MYDANPRTHLVRATEMLSSAGLTDYCKLRYAALDLRLTIETTLQEILSACYSEFATKFESFWQTKDFIKEIRRQNPDFDLKNRLLPAVVAHKKKIADYPELDLDRLSSIHGRLGDHLHHLNRYDPKKAAAERPSQLAALVTEEAKYLTALLKYPRYWAVFYEHDDVLFREVLSGTRTVENFEKHIRDGKLKSFGVIDVHHHQEFAKQTSAGV